jgi:hypothetical protein
MICEHDQATKTLVDHLQPRWSEIRVATQGYSSNTDNALVTEDVLLAALGVGRARIAKRSILRTVAETVSIGVAAALAGVAIGMLIDHSFSS